MGTLILILIIIGLLLLANSIPYASGSNDHYQEPEDEQWTSS